MGRQITREILESYLYCKTKAHLKLDGQQGSVSDYEKMLAENRQEVRQAAISIILAQHPEAEVAKDIALNIAALRAGPSIVLDATLDDAQVTLNFDGIKRVDGPSKLGDFHYVPMLFYEGEKLRQEQRVLLAVLGTLLGDLQGRQPELGIVYLGHECRGTKVRLAGRLQERARIILREITDLGRDSKPPKLMLNNHCQVCEFREHCRRQAEQEDCLSLLGGMGEKELRKHNRKGIFTITQLSCTFRLRKRGKRVKRKNQPHYFALQAAAIRDRKTYVLKPPALAVSPVRIYFDIEGTSDRSFAYLLGMIIDERGIETKHSLWADTRDDEQAIFQKMLEIIAQYDDFTLIHYGSYESYFLRRMKKVFDGNPTFDKIIKLAVNLLPIISSHIYFPVHSNGLKTVGRNLGYDWADPDASGLKTIVMRKQWETLPDESIKQALERYNLEDCEALKRVSETVFTICDELAKEKGEPEIALERCVVARAEDINTVSTRREYGKASFVIDDFEFINGCAYFDYQRERVFLRTNESVRRANYKNNRKRRSKKPKVNRTIEVRCKKCPRCDGSDIVRGGGRPHTKLAYDLRLSESGINRQVIACTARVHRCNECGKSFLPPRYMRRAKHFHGLKSWAIYQHIVHRISFQRLEAMIEECFGFHVHYEEIFHFKALMVHYYQDTYRRILANLLKGGLLHCDETHVNLQKGKGYVWVLANMENAVYVYRPTRDGDWLQDLLIDFKGILVSDFYSAYDSLPCPQQKCLVHLIRDMNHDLLSNPYDDEFKALISDFGLLLRGIVSTIDRYGLKHYHLRKHENDVSKFYRGLSDGSFSSDLAQEYRQRLGKYRDKLFTFLKYDGVPWNNNNAEHAFRPFANYRKTSDGQMTESGLRDYLVLLTIYQTCKYRGVSFLRFLLSQQRDLDRFQDPGRMKYSKPCLQTYPEGFYNFTRKGKDGPRKPIYPNG